MLLNRFSCVFFMVLRIISGGFGDFLYRFVLVLLLVGFFSLRVPYSYGFGGFGLFVFWLVSVMFLGLLFTRLFSMDVSKFFCEFVPVGTPLEIAPFVCLAETLSYLIRPFVLMIRPFVNLTVGALGGHAIAYGCFFSEWVWFCLVLLFFYEVFVTIVHWFIVMSILSFSENH